MWRRCSDSCSGPSTVGRLNLFISLVLVTSFLAPPVTALRNPSSFSSGLRLPSWPSSFPSFVPSEHSSSSSSSSLSSNFAVRDGKKKFNGTRWALLIAGSNGYGNYRHQADVCHAYQVLKKDGLSDDNIVVFMYDDIAHHPENPRRGEIINRPDGPDVYAGVPKDYTGSDVNVHNFLAALRGDASAIRGGSGKVIASGPNDHVFVFYSDHGAPGILGMPTVPFLLGDDVVRTLQDKYNAGGYGELVFYLEACESGSIFEGTLPPHIDVFAVTAANAQESSWATYCPGMDPSPPPEYDTCLGDLFSVGWMEDSEVHNLEKETLLQQYHVVKKRTMNGKYYMGSHVMRYGEKKVETDLVVDFIGTDPANADAPGGDDDDDDDDDFGKNNGAMVVEGSVRRWVEKWLRDGLTKMLQKAQQWAPVGLLLSRASATMTPLVPSDSASAARSAASATTAAAAGGGGASTSGRGVEQAAEGVEWERLSAGQRLFYSGQHQGAVRQRDAEMLHLWLKMQRAEPGSSAAQAAKARFTAAVQQRMREDEAVRGVAVALFGKLPHEALTLMVRDKHPEGHRSAGSPFVDDWDCLRATIRAFEQHCGNLTQYSMQYTPLFANICNHPHLTVSRHSSPVDAVSWAAAVACEPLASGAVGSTADF